MLRCTEHSDITKFNVFMSKMYCILVHVCEIVLIWVESLNADSHLKQIISVFHCLVLHYHQRLCYKDFFSYNWMAPWKNQISFTTMKLRKSLIKPVMRQNISSCLVLPPEIVMHYALMLFSEHPAIYASSCMTILDGRTEQHIVIGFGELAAVD